MEEKHEVKMEDTSSVSSRSATPNEEEKNLGSQSPTQEATSSPTPVREGESEMTKVNSRAISAKDAREELTKIMTSEEGTEYPTGMKLNLVSLALCLSVFLMALDNTIVSDHSLHLGGMRTWHRGRSNTLVGLDLLQ